MIMGGQIMLTGILAVFLFGYIIHIFEVDDFSEWAGWGIILMFCSGVIATATGALMAIWGY